MASIADLRRNYTQAGLLEADVAADPITQFDTWFKQAREVNTGEWFEVNAFTLSTVDPLGRPSARVMLLKDYEEAGFTFYTNFQSRKGQDLGTNPHVAMTFYWPSLERQVRIEGSVSTIDRATAETYFHSRPRGNQLGALVSQQSAAIPDRDMLEKELTALDARYKDLTIPMPEHWGGYLVTHQTVEFWQGRESRLHDRLLYTRTATAWQLTRLSP